MWRSATPSVTINLGSNCTDPRIVERWLRSRVLMLDAATTIVLVGRTTDSAQPAAAAAAGRTAVSAGVVSVERPTHKRARRAIAGRQAPRESSGAATAKLTRHQRRRFCEARRSERLIDGHL